MMKSKIAFNQDGDSVYIDKIKKTISKLSPVYQIRNPVMFVTYCGAIILSAQYLYTQSSFTLIIALWLWATVLFAGLSETIAEAKGKAQAKALKKTREEVQAKKLRNKIDFTNYEMISSDELKVGDYVLVQAGDVIPGDGQVIKGIAAVNESAITGESAPVIREAEGDRDAVTGGTQIISDWLVFKVTANPGETFLDKMIHLVESAKRRKTPNEIALSVLLAGISLLFLVLVMSLMPLAEFYSKLIQSKVQYNLLNTTALIALLICLIPTTIGGLLSAIGIAGMDRLIQANVIALSGRAIEAAGDVDVLLVDKTGTITLGNRQAVEFFAFSNVDINKMARAAYLASITDNTPEGKSIVKLAQVKYQTPSLILNEDEYRFVPFTAETRMSGIVSNQIEIYKGAADAIIKHIKSLNASVSPEVMEKVNQIAKTGSTPLLVIEQQDILGVIQLKDIIKAGMKERFSQLRAMGIKSVMITGDNPLTAGAIASEAGVDDFIAEATPETKLTIIKKYQEKGLVVAMVGDGTNDAPALAQTDVALAMNSGTQACKEAANMIDLDSNPTKLIEVVKIGKQLLMTRGALTTFSISNDIAKYFAILPAVFSGIIPGVDKLNILQLSSAENAILSAVIFNALIIVALIPLALKGVKLEAKKAETLLFKNLMVFGLGGVLAPFIGIKMIDWILQWF
jgi:K+-transporting ATPase ATPase B chain